MATIDEFKGLSAWLASRLGYNLESMRSDTVRVLANALGDEEPLLAYKVGHRAVMRVKPEWVDAITSVTNGLSLDELFSLFGCYELARITLADNVGVWGPSWYFFADQDCFTPSFQEDAIRLNEEEIAATDNLDIFWHCGWKGADANFGILEGDQVIALATVRSLGSPVYEIDVDVSPNSNKRGLGRAVTSAAGQWILEQGGLILARTAQWNVPSARLLRSLGMKYVLCDLEGKSGPFRVPPQPLGKPLPTVPIYNLYPDWAMNSEIQKRSEI